MWREEECWSAVAHEVTQVLAGLLSTQMRSEDVMSPYFDPPFLRHRSTYTIPPVHAEYVRHYAGNADVIQWDWTAWSMHSFEGAELN